MTETVDASLLGRSHRWGQASALFGSLFVVQGGKTSGGGTGGGGYTYTSGPNSADLLVLDLSQPWSSTSAPWQAIQAASASNTTTNSTTAPAVSFHSITPTSSSQLVLFGGDGAPIVPVQTNNDSLYLLDLAGTGTSRTASWSTGPTTWNEPMRRIYHHAETDTNGKLWIVGGEKDDGSNMFLDELWSFDQTSAAPAFAETSSAPPGSIVDGTLSLLSDGTLLLMGGLDKAGQLQPLDVLYSYSTKDSKWDQTTTTASGNTTTTAQRPSSRVPAPRRGHVAVTLPNQRIFIQGGANADMTVAYDDAWVLDWSVTPPCWTELPGANGPGMRFGHSAVAYGERVVVAFGEWALLKTLVHARSC